MFKNAVNWGCGQARKLSEGGKALALAVVTAVGLSVAGVPQAQAALPTGVDTALTGIQTDAASLMDLAVPVVIAVLGMTVIIKLIKRFTNKI